LCARLIIAKLLVIFLFKNTHKFCALQILILTPTREIAAQVGDVLTNIGQGFSGENIYLCKKQKGHN